MKELVNLNHVTDANKMFNIVVNIPNVAHFGVSFVAYEYMIYNIDNKYSMKKVFAETLTYKLQLVLMHEKKFSRNFCYMYLSLILLIMHAKCDATDTNIAALVFVKFYLFRLKND